MIIVKKLNEVFLKIDAEIDQYYELKKFFSVKVENFFWHPKFRANLWDGTITFFNIRDLTLPIGLLPKFHKFCEKFSYEYKLDFDTNCFKNIINKNDLKSFCDFLLKNTGKEIRDYQFETFYNCVRRKRGTILSATSSGKSLNIYLIIRYLISTNFDKKILLIVPNITLVKQMFTEFAKEYRWRNIADKVEILYSEVKPTFQKQVLISTWQSLMRKKPIFFNSYGCLIIDEVHGVKQKKNIQNIAKDCINAEYRFGFTGTLDDSKANNMTVQGYIGPLIQNISSNELIEKGWLSNIKIRNVIIKYPENIVQRLKRANYHYEVEFVENYNDRNYAFKKIFKDEIKDSDNTIILFQHLEHLKRVKNYFENNIKNRRYKIRIITGKIKPDEREKIREEVELLENMIIFATYGTSSVGLNIPRLHNVILASSTKSKIRVLQTIGRGLRKHEEKEFVVVFDLIDNLSYQKVRKQGLNFNHLFKHFLQRKKYYVEQKFAFENLKIDL